MVRVGKVFRVMGFFYVSIQWGVTSGNISVFCLWDNSYKKPLLLIANSSPLAISVVLYHMFNTI